MSSGNPTKLAKPMPHRRQELPTQGICLPTADAFQKMSEQIDSMTDLMVQMRNEIGVLRAELNSRFPPVEEPSTARVVELAAASATATASTSVTALAMAKSAPAPPEVEVIAAASLRSSSLLEETKMKSLDGGNKDSGTPLGSLQADHHGGNKENKLKSRFQIPSTRISKYQQKRTSEYLQKLLSR